MNRICVNPLPVATAIAAAIFSAALSCPAHADLRISTKATKHVTCSGGVCQATAPTATLNVSDLAGMLAAGDVSVASGSIAHDITVSTVLSWTSTSRLTLDSFSL